jgi:hypothetical protein
VSSLDVGEQQRDGAAEDVVRWGISGRLGGSANRLAWRGRLGCQAGCQLSPELYGCRGGLGIELLPQGLHEPVIDSQRLRAPSVTRQQPDEAPGRPLVAWIGLEQSVQRGERAIQVAAPLAVTSERKLQVGPGPLQGLAALGRPVLVQVVGQVVAAVERVRHLETGERIVGPLRLGDRLFKGLGVNPDLGVWP